jgi:hypothetical protein
MWKEGSKMSERKHRSKLKGKVELTYINPDGTKESELVSIEKARKEFQKEWRKQNK